MKSSRLFLVLMCGMLLFLPPESQARGAPTITRVAFSGALGQNLQINIKGSGFGSAPARMPISANLWQFSFNDNTPLADGTEISFEAGHVGDAVLLRYLSWTDNEITIGGFAGYFGYGKWRVSPGDYITIRVSPRNSNDNFSPKAIWTGTLKEVLAQPEVAINSPAEAKSILRSPNPFNHSYRPVARFQGSAQPRSGSNSPQLGRLPQQDHPQVTSGSVHQSLISRILWIVGDKFGPPASSCFSASSL